MFLSEILKSISGSRVIDENPFPGPVKVIVVCPKCYKIYMPFLTGERCPRCGSSKINEY